MVATRVADLVQRRVVPENPAQHLKFTRSDRRELDVHPWAITTWLRVVFDEVEQELRSDAAASERFYTRYRGARERYVYPLKTLGVESCR